METNMLEKLKQRGSRLTRARKLLADIFEILTGSRFYYYFLKPGGNRAPVTEGWLEKVIEAAGTLKARLQEYSVFIGFNRSVVERRHWLL